MQGNGAAGKETDTTHATECGYGDDEIDAAEDYVRLLLGAAGLEASTSAAARWQAIEINDLQIDRDLVRDLAHAGYALAGGDRQLTLVEGSNAACKECNAATDTHLQMPQAKREQTLTAAGSFTGTPLYLSPEGINAPDKVDARSDLYAVGAVGYFLLTGKALFDSESVVKVIMHQVDTLPPTPSERLGREIDTELEQVLMQCLAKDPNDRPPSAKQLEGLLRACACTAEWSEEDASRWWQQNVDGVADPSKDNAKKETSQIDATLTLERPKL